MTKDLPEILQPLKEIDPYEVLDVSKTATRAEIRKAYFKLALNRHPDKVSELEKEAAHAEFQGISLAYAVLSDDARRKRYDDTGSLSESNDDFDWKSYFDEMWSGIVNGEVIEAFKKEYQGSADERLDLLDVYKSSKGSWDVIFDTIMLSNELEDQDRFKEILDEAIENGEIPKYKKYTQDKTREKRMKKAKKEMKEAEAMKKELKLDEVKGEGDLMQLIKKRQANRMEEMINGLEAKYTKIENEKKAKKRRAK